MKIKKILILTLTVLLTTAAFSAVFPQRESHLMFLRKEMSVEGNLKTGYIIYADKREGRYVHTDAGSEGISCVDDTARAGIYFLNMYENTREKDSHAAQRYRELFLETLDFCDAFRTRTGDYYNFIFENGEINKRGITSRTSANWWALRALWLLSQSLTVIEDSEDFNTEKIYDEAEQTATLFVQELDATGLIRGYADLSALYVISLANLYEFSGESKWLELIHQVSDGLLGKRAHFIFDGIIDEGTEKFIFHSWGSRQVQALAMAFTATHDDKYLEAAKDMADSLYTHMINLGPFYDYDTENFNLFSQIAYGTEAAVTSLYQLYQITGDEAYAWLLALNAGFFSGNNQLQRAMTGENGEGYDGLEKVFINTNSGAESTISYLLSMSLVDRLPETIRRFAEMKPVHQSEPLLIEAENMDSGLSSCDTENINGFNGVSGRSFKLKETFTLNRGTYDIFLFGTGLKDSEIKFYLGKETIGKNILSDTDHYLGRIKNTADEEVRIIFSGKSEEKIFLNQILCLPVIEYQVFNVNGINYLAAFNTSDEEMEFNYQPIEKKGYLLSEANFDIDEKETAEQSVYEVGSTEVHSGYIVLKLNAFMDNNGIGMPVNPGNYDNLGGKAGAYYPEEKIRGLLTGGFLYPDGIPFRILLEENDNLIAGGQRLMINETGTTLYVFGSCDHGSFNGDLEIGYSDGEREYTSLSFPDWCSEIRDEDSIALQVPYRYDSSDLEEWIAPKIAICKIPLKGKKIESITIPEIPTMHLFGITLGK